MSCGERQIQRGGGTEKWAELYGLLALQGYGGVLAWTAVKDSVFIPGLAIVMVCVDVHVSCYL